MHSQGTVRPPRSPRAAGRSAIGAITFLGATAVLVLLLAGAAAASAQEPSPEKPGTVQAPAEVPPDDAKPAAAEEEKPTFAESITVTANKRPEDVQDVAASVSVVDALQLENLSAKQLTDFAAYVPGLNVTSDGTPGQTTITLRGIAPISSGATVATYIGEAPLGSSGIYQRATGFALDLLPHDIERVEVLRGPQGTLYGAGAMGGLLKYVPRDPDLSARQVLLDVGLSDVARAGGAGRDAAFTANLPLAADRVALRASYARNDTPGYIDDALNRRQGINGGEQESARAALLWQASDAVRLKLDAMHQLIDSDNNATVALAPGTLRPLGGDLTNVLAVNEPFRKRLDLYLATLEWELGWARLTSASGYSDASTDQRQDATFLVGEFPLILGLPPGISFFDLELGLKKLTQELRFTSTAKGPFEWQLGGFYADEKADNSQTIRLQTTGGTPIPGLDPLAVAALPSDYKETAVFGNTTFHLTERFQLDAGARFSRNRQTFAQVVTQGILLPIGRTPGRSEEDVFTWSVGPQLRLSGQAMLYARVATGYQPGGPNVALPGVPPKVDSSRLTSYEVGLKSERADHRWLFDLAAYSLDWRDIQIGAINGGVSFLVNGGKATSRGIELSSAFRPTERLRLELNGAYTDATVSNDVPSLGGKEGDHLPYVPKLSWSATADYYFRPLGRWSGHAGGGYRWVDKRKSSLDSNPVALPLDSYGALDLNAEVFNERWSIRIFARNVTDERAYQTIGAVTSLVTGVTHHVSATPIQPRTVGVALGLTF